MFVCAKKSQRLAAAFRARKCEVRSGFARLVSRVLARASLRGGNAAHQENTRQRLCQKYRAIPHYFTTALACRSIARDRRGSRMRRSGKRGSPWIILPSAASPSAGAPLVPTAKSDARPSNCPRRDEARNAISNPPASHRFRN